MLHDKVIKRTNASPTNTKKLFGIDEEPIEFEWNIFLGHTKDRIIFMSMFNDIDWTEKENHNECFSNSEKVKNYAK